MKGYQCEVCKMEIKPLECNKCGCNLLEKVIEKNGQQIKVAQCPKCQGKVKAPFCCGHDMKCSC